MGDYEVCVQYASRSLDGYAGVELKIIDNVIDKETFSGVTHKP
jgi:hypothetical protein